jgi:hypothetical protein
MNEVEKELPPHIMQSKLSVKLLIIMHRNPVKYCANNVRNDLPLLKNAITSYPQHRFLLDFNLKHWSIASKLYSSSGIPSFSTVLPFL